MDSTGYIALSRQSGLMREMQAVAHNIANHATTGFRREGVIFAEFVRGTGAGDSLSMAHLHGRLVSPVQGALIMTGGEFDFAIEGDGYFLVATPQGERLTRSGSFIPNEAGELVSADGALLLDAGAAPLIVPPGATDIHLSADGTLSAGGMPLGQIGLVTPPDPGGLHRERGTLFRADDGVEAVEGARLLQGHLEESNVDPVREVARMIEVQRAYELGQQFLDREDERIRGVIQTLGR
ncbi:flagellar hook-basal body complex protein [Alkalilacustris brevis]|uniref:flagellar hook-basal body complex protein n=1 Tax=Alkalilacustris brevis TaxID=2026338 RepID=UPI000E0DC387|nr:flagellar hook-basal body complex protein [Alkalilacustris brevis]